jgi:hypothetical protein
MHACSVIAIPSALHLSFNRLDAKSREASILLEVKEREQLAAAIAARQAHEKTLRYGVFRWHGVRVIVRLCVCVRRMCACDCMHVHVCVPLSH